MAKTTGIAWCDHTFNPWWGCAKVAPECANCYAETWAKRTGYDLWGLTADRRQFGDSHWKEPIRWDKEAAQTGERKRVFCASMADVFEGRPSLDGHRARLWGLIEKTPWLDWLLLTKRPKHVVSMCPQSILDKVWVGVTGGTRQTLNANASTLIEIRCKVRFVSVEPLLEAVDLEQFLFRSVANTSMHYDRNGKLRGSGRGGQMICSRPLNAIHWVIVGCESGKKARPMDDNWVRSVRDECQDAGVAFFFKQAMRDGKLVSLPELDGRTWAEFPR